MRSVLVIGGGMITHDQILPSLLHLQRTGQVGGIEVCARTHTTIDALAAARALQQKAYGRNRPSRSRKRIH